MHPHSQFPHADDALSIASSLAFILPFRKNHAGKEFRDGVLIGLVAWSLMFTILFGAIYFWGD